MRRGLRAGTLVAGLCCAAAGLTALALPRHLGYRAPDELVLLWNRLQSYEIPRLWISEPEFAEYRDRTHSFQSLAAYSVTSYELGGSQPAERLPGRKVTASLFPLLGVAPHLGRTILPEEDIPGADRVAVISHGLWRRLFKGDPLAVGQTLRLDAQSVTVIGIMPEDFVFPSPEVQLWTPLRLDLQHPGDRQAHYLTVLGRLRPEIGISDAQAELSSLVRGLSRRHYRNAGWEVVLESLREELSASQGADPGLQPLQSLAFDGRLETRRRQEPARSPEPLRRKALPRVLPCAGATRIDSRITA